MQIAYIKVVLSFKVQKEVLYATFSSALGKRIWTLFHCIIAYDNLVFFSGVAKNYKYERQSYFHCLVAEFCSIWEVKLHSYSCGRTSSKFKQPGTTQTRNDMQIMQCMKQPYSIFFIRSWQVYFSWYDDVLIEPSLKLRSCKRKARNVLRERESNPAELKLAGVPLHQIFVVCGLFPINKPLWGFLLFCTTK